MTTTLGDRQPADADDDEANSALPVGPPLSLSRLARWFLAMSLVLFTIRKAIDPDMFWHLRTGEWIVENGIPRTDVFSFTVPENEWVTHEWLSQVLAWGGYSVGGFAGVSLLFGVVGVATMMFTYRTLDGGPLQRVLLTLATMFVATIAFGARPQLFTLAFAAGFVWLIERIRRGDVTDKAIWWTIPATMVWANLHSGFVLGCVILVTYAVGDLLDRRFFSPDPLVLPARSAVKLMTAAGLCFAVAIVNPSGPKLWIYPFQTLGSEEMRILINEWHSPDFHQGVVRPFLAMIVFGIVVLAASKRRPTVTELLLVCGTTVAALTSLRHIAVAAIVVMPVLARHLSSATEGTRVGPWLAGDRDRGFGVGPIFAGLIALVLAVVVVVQVNTTWSTNDSEVAEFYPVAAVDWLEETGLIDDHGYHSYGWGGYLIWRNVEVFSDGRADVYGDEFLWQVIDLFEADGDWKASLDSYAVQWALLPADQPMSTVLLADPDWELSYEDEVALVITRVG